MPKLVAARWPVANVHADLNVNHLGKPGGARNMLRQSPLTRSLKLKNLHRLDFVKIDVDRIIESTPSCGDFAAAWRSIGHGCLSN